MVLINYTAIMAKTNKRQHGTKTNSRIQHVYKAAVSCDLWEQFQYNTCTIASHLPLQARKQYMVRRIERHKKRSHFDKPRMFERHGNEAPVACIAVKPLTMQNVFLLNFVLASKNGKMYIVFLEKILLNEFAFQALARTFYACSFLFVSHGKLVQVTYSVTLPAFVLWSFFVILLRFSIPAKCRLEPIYYRNFPWPFPKLSKIAQLHQ